MKHDPDSADRWTCPRCQESFGRRSAHTVDGDRCKAFALTREMLDAGYVTVSGEQAVMASKHAPRLIACRKTCLDKNAPMKFHAWLKQWVLIVFDNYQKPIPIFQFARSTEEENRRDAMNLTTLLTRVERDETLQQAILATAALTQSDPFEDQSNGSAVYELLMGALNGS